MTADAIWGALVTGVLAIVTLICGKCRCYVRQHVDGDGEQKAPEWACGFTDKNFSSRQHTIRTTYTYKKTMRHYSHLPARHPNFIDRAARAWDTGSKIYGLVKGAYEIGKVAAPYVAAAMI